ncbi:MAG: endopeptidase La, partial [Sulfuricella sp.]|nr:endopeptidase La [Sulfuricella sp.]
MPRKKKTTLDQELLEGEVLRSTDVEEEAAALVPAGIYPTTLYLLPLSERPFFPAQTLPLLMNEGPWLETVKKIGETRQQMAGIILVNLPHTEGARPGDFYSIGTLVRMHHPVRAEGKIQF